MLPLAALGQGAPTGSSESVEQRLQRLEQRQAELEKELRDRDAEIQELKKSQPAAAPQPSPSPPEAAVATAASPALAASPATPPRPLYGTYTDNLGFKVVDTDKGDMSISLFTYVRYLNQLATDSTYTNDFGVTKSVQRSNSVQLLKAQFKFLGWIVDPRLRYFLYAWSSNASQGKGAQVVLGGNLNYTFNSHLTLSGGIAALPGSRSTEGNFPYWLSNDNRMISDEFFRPSYTSGFWARGDIVPGVRYQVMVGNNMSQLGVSSAQLDNHFDTWSGALYWFPTTGEYGPGFSPGFGDFEFHDKFATRLGMHVTTSTEDKQSQPDTDQFENTQIRLSDGTVIFTPNVFGPGVTVTQLQVNMVGLDAGFKYRGFAVEAEGYWRQLGSFQGPGTNGLPTDHAHGLQLQTSMMAIPKTLQLYISGAKVYGDYGEPYEVRGGFNWFPFENQVFRVNGQVMYMYHSPVGGGSLPYQVGSTGTIFYTDFMMAM